MISGRAKVYRRVLSELRQSMTSTRKINHAVRASFRQIIERGDSEGLEGAQNAALFLRAQREHKLLLERYNPMSDMSPSERNHATARRVGLDMPIEHKPEE